MKKLLFIELALLVLGSLTGCGARRRAVMATATAQALTATAIAQPPVATAPAVSATRTMGAILFQDDFQDGQPDGWQITAAWYVQQEGDVYYFGSSGQGGAWVPGGGSWSDYEFQSTVRVTAGGAILSYRLTQEGRYLLHLREDGLYLTKEYPKGNYTTLTQTAAPSLNAWHQVSVAGYGGHLQVYVDRMLQLDYTDPSPLLQGTIAVATLEGSQAAVDDVLVTRLMTALPTPAPMALPPTVAPPATPLPEEAGLPLEEVPPPEEVAPPPSPPVAGLPVIDYFRSEPSEREGCYYLHWELHDASVAYLNDVGVVAPGSEEVCPDESGVYVYTLRAENDVGDVEETLTFEAGGEVGPPDLEIGDVSVWVPAPTEPGTVAIQIPVNNVGSGPAGAFTVRWYPHQASGEVGCSLDIMGLDAGVGQILTCPPYPYAGHGEMHWRAIVDEDNEIQNDPKGNNEARGTVRIEAGEGQQPQPDLVITGAHFEQGGQTVAQVVAGQPFNAVFQVANQSSAPTGPFTIVWHFHEATGLKNCCSRDYPDGLDAGAWGGGTFPNLVTTAQAGGSPTWVEVDSGNRVEEGEGEGNNRFDLPSGLTVVEAELSSQADLVIRNLSIEPNPVLLGGIGVFTVSFDVVNEGDAQAAPSTAHWEIVADNRWNFDCPVSALAPGASAQCENAFVGLPSEAGNYGTRAVADAGNVVQEGPEGEENNEMRETLRVQQ